MKRGKNFPNFFYENQLWKKGYRFIAGVDEVGRGCFAGPVVAGAVAFAPTKSLELKAERLKQKSTCDTHDTPRIDDSKKLTVRQRKVANEWIRKNALTWGIGEASVSEINRLGMAKATRSAFRRAVVKANQRLHLRLEFLLIDAFFVPYLRGLPKGRKKRIKGDKNPKMADRLSRQLAIINGDEKSVSIAAASIIAKVYRDCLMEKIGRRACYKKYDWPSNKGYASEVHRQALFKYGATCHHRKQFVETFLKNSKYSNLQAN